MAAEADRADSDRRALADGLFLRIDARLGARDEREETGVAAAVSLARFLPERSRLPDCLRAVRRRLPVALRGGGRPDAARAAGGGVPALAARLPAVVTDRRSRRLARARRCDRPHRSQAWASLRAEPLEGVDAPRNRAKPPGVRSPRSGAHGRCADSQHRWHDRRNRGALRRRSLAGHIRRVPRNGPWSTDCRAPDVNNPARSGPFSCGVPLDGASCRRTTYEVCAPRAEIARTCHYRQG